MILNPDQCYQSLLTHDARFDGRFFVAVRTTRIYCRPICRVKPPLRRNCTFYTHAAEAEVAGYRPCKMCRPELAPGLSPMDIGSWLARSTAAHLNQDYLGDHSLADLSRKLGITDRQMRRVFQAEFGVSPIEYWQTQRLLLAKQLLTDSSLSVTSVALASGYQSLRRFNFALKERYRMTPTELRHRQKTSLSDPGAEFSFRLGYRPPFDWEQLLGFLSRRAIPGVERIANGAYLRTVRIARQGVAYAGFIEVRHEAKRRTLAVRLADSLIPVCVPVLERVRRLFDLGADPAAISETLGPLANPNPGLRVPGSFEPFEMAVRAILGQQISVAGATTLTGKFAAKFGDPAAGLLRGVSFHFPTPARVAEIKAESIKELGMTTRRAETILALARAIAGGTLLLEPGHRVEGTLKTLRNIPGIGEWTAQYLAMRALSWPDAFPHTDLGVMKALGEKNPRKILAAAEKWRPWRAYATLHLWASLEKKIMNTQESRSYYWKRIPSPIGALTLIATERGLAAILWEKDSAERLRFSPLVCNDQHPVLLAAERELREYFAGERTSFSVALDAAGTDFQKSVWRALSEIPFGETRSYGDIARRLGNPGAVRAVGAANGRNPIPIIVPCHRVIGASGRLTGFAGGLEIKSQLLALETLRGKRPAELALTSAASAG